MRLIPRNIANFRRQLERGGLMVDWRYSVDTTDPRYYRWTQWVFLKLYEKGLAYKKKAAVNWCPERQDRARERAGHQRRVRALRRDGRAAVPGAVVLPHQRVLRSGC